MGWWKQAALFEFPYSADETSFPLRKRKVFKLRLRKRKLNHIRVAPSPAP